MEVLLVWSGAGLLASVGILILAVAYVILRDGFGEIGNAKEFLSLLEVALGQAQLGASQIEELHAKYKHLFDENTDVLVVLVAKAMGVSPDEVVNLLNRAQEESEETPSG